jgi:hypothetical protein
MRDYRPGYVPTCVQCGLPCGSYMVELTEWVEWITKYESGHPMQSEQRRRQTFIACSIECVVKRLNVERKEE